MNHDYDMRFWTTLIKVKGYLTPAQNKALKDNCTKVTATYWIMEGDTDYLRDAGIHFSEVAEGAVGTLGDLTEQELRQVCWDNYRVQIP